MIMIIEGLETSIKTVAALIMATRLQDNVQCTIHLVYVDEEAASHYLIQ